jgi:hypothetical protein
MSVAVSPRAGVGAADEPLASFGASREQASQAPPIPCVGAVFPPGTVACARLCGYIKGKGASNEQV